jgi:stage III sporulation protein AE
VKKIRRIAVIFLFLLLLLPASPVFATDILKEATGLDHLDELIPKDMTPDDLLVDTDVDSLLGKDVFSVIWSGLKGMFFSGLSSYLAFFLSLVAMLVLCAFLKSVKENIAKDSYGKAFDILSLLILSAFLYTFIDAAFDEAAACLTRANTFMTAMVPITTALYAVGGNVTTATVQNATLLFALSFLQTLTSSLLLPMLRFCFAFSLVGLVSPVKLGSITNLVKTVASTLCVFFLTLLSAILYFQSALSSAADSVGIRSVKFLIGLIPVVGNLVGEASKTVGSGVAYIRSVTGLFGVVIILSILAVPLCRLGARKLFLSLGQAAASILGLENEAAFIKESASLLTLLFAVLLSSAVYFILALTLFMKTAVVAS